MGNANSELNENWGTASFHLLTGTYEASDLGPNEAVVRCDEYQKRIAIPMSDGKGWAVKDKAGWYFTRSKPQSGYKMKMSLSFLGRVDSDKRVHEWEKEDGNETNNG